MEEREELEEKPELVDNPSPERKTEETAPEEKAKLEEKPSRVKRFIKETIRVLRITKKPDKEEYKSTVKVTALGAAIIGAIGFVLFLGKQLLF